MRLRVEPRGGQSVVVSVSPGPVDVLRRVVVHEIDEPLVHGEDQVVQAPTMATTFVRAGVFHWRSGQGTHSEAGNLDERLAVFATAHEHQAGIETAMYDVQAVRRRQAANELSGNLQRIFQVGRILIDRFRYALSFEGVGDYANISSGILQAAYITDVFVHQGRRSRKPYSKSLLACGQAQRQTDVRLAGP